MAKGLVIYYSRSGNTQEMAEIIASSMNSAGLDTELKAIGDVSMDDMTSADAVVIGSPTYYGQMAGEVKKFIDDSVKRHGKFDGKVGGAFASSVNIGGGNETTTLGIINCLMVHGFVIQGDSQGDHYGPVSISKPNERTKKQCQRYGERIAKLTLKLFG